MAQPTVLIIEANRDAQDAMSAALKDAGYPVLAASTASEGMALLTSLRPQVVLLDLDLPGTDTFELLGQMRVEAADAVVLGLSRVQEPHFVVRAMRAGASDFLPKPSTGAGLQSAVRTALARVEPAAMPDLGAATAAEADRFWPDLDLLFRNSEKMRAVENIVRRAADTNATIIIQGESGTGKEMVAKAVHFISDRRDKPFLKVNCASLPGELLESELFGHEKGAFTGAHRRKPGKFELAHRGTFMLDEIGEMPLALQAKLLHVLQDGKFFRVGGTELIDTDVRLIAASNRDLATLVAAGQFREDLYYRLNVVTILVPPLRERTEEIPLLVSHFLRRFCLQYEREAPRISADTMAMLRDYFWPGNVRELENMIKRLVVLQNEALIRDEITLRRTRGPMLTVQPVRSLAAAGPPSLPQGAPTILDTSLGLKEIAKRAAMEAEKTVLKEVLDRVRWNRAEAARLLKISYKALLYKITAAGLDAKGDRAGQRK